MKYSLRNPCVLSHVCPSVYILNILSFWTRKTWCNNMSFKPWNLFCFRRDLTLGLNIHISIVWMRSEDPLSVSLFRKQFCWFCTLFDIALTSFYLWNIIAQFVFHPLGQHYFINRQPLMCKQENDNIKAKKTKIAQEKQNKKRKLMFLGKWD